MKNSFKEIEELLVRYIANEVTDSEKEKLNNWRKESPENEKQFQEIQKGWEAIPMLKEMERFNSFDALKKVSSRIEKVERKKWLIILQKAAAILFIPLIIYNVYLTMQTFSVKQSSQDIPMFESIKVKQGELSQFTLNDGTRVWLNSGATLKFPNKFVGEKREIELNGEAYFEVTENKKQPFIVNANKLDIEVLGTSFNVSSYQEDSISEVVLVTGKIKLAHRNKQFGYLEPGKKATFIKSQKKVYAEKVDVDKYISWKDGTMIFRDDPMNEVVKRLSRWFNVEIVIKDPEIENYIYTATFTNETLSQVLYLLKVSAPINYIIHEPKRLSNGEISKQKIVLMKK